jgi:ribosome-binding factor A
MTRKAKSAREPSQRQLRVGEDLRHHLAAILMRQETHIAELDSVSITVSEVSVSPDLSSARVYVMTLGGAEMDVILPLLNQYAPVLRHQVAQRVHLRRLPVFKFVRDESYETAERMARLFSGIQSKG